MSSLPEMDAEHLGGQREFENAAPLAVRSSTVVLGRMDFFSVLLRLIGMELYKIRRRSMSRVLGTLAVLLALLVPLAIGIEVVTNQKMPARNFAPPCRIQLVHCAPLSATELERAKQTSIANLSQPLRLPASLEIATTQVEFNPAILLLIILVGSMTGGEMSIGTVRLLFTRGPWRGQFLLARYGAALVCTVFGVLGMALSGMIVGQVFNFWSGVPQSFAFLNAMWAGHALLYLLVTMLNWFMYAAVAIFFGVLGRSTVSGVVGGITWFFVEPIVSNVLSAAGNVSLGGFGIFMRMLPDYFMGNNARSLQLNQAQYLFGSGGIAHSNWAALVVPLIVLTVYLTTFISLTWWLNESRDVTN